MPNIPVPRDASIPNLDSLAPRQPASLLERPRALDFSANNPVAPNALDKKSLEARRIYESLIPTYYTYGGPAAGTVVGLVLGSVAGFLLLVWLFYSLANIGAAGTGGAHIAGEEEIVVRRRRNSHSGRSRRSTRTEVREYSRSPRRPPVVVEERRTPRQTRTRSIIVEERARVPNDDVVEVIEEHDEYRSRRGSRRY